MSYSPWSRPRVDQNLLYEKSTCDAARTNDCQRLTAEARGYSSTYKSGASAPPPQLFLRVDRELVM